MERRIDVGACVGEQLDLPDLEGRAGGVAGLGRIARQPVADHGHREPGVGDHSVLDHMAQIDQPTGRRCHGAAGGGGGGGGGGARRAGSCPQNCCSCPYSSGCSRSSWTGFSKNVSVATAKNSALLVAPYSSSADGRSWAASRRNRSYSAESTPPHVRRALGARSGAPSVTPSSASSWWANSCNTTFSPSAGLRAPRTVSSHEMTTTPSPHDSPIRRAGGGAISPVPGDRATFGTNS